MIVIVKSCLQIEGNDYLVARIKRGYTVQHKRVPYTKDLNLIENTTVLVLYFDRPFERSRIEEQVIRE